MKQFFKLEENNFFSEVKKENSLQSPCKQRTLEI